MWWKWTSSINGVVEFTPTTLVDGDTDTAAVSVFTGTDLESLEKVVEAEGSQSVTFQAFEDVTYYLRIVPGLTTFGAWFGHTIELDWVQDTTGRPLNDSLSNATLLTGATGSIGGTNANATLETGESGDGVASVWYQWNAPSRPPSGDDLELEVTAAFPTVLEVYSAAPVGSMPGFATTSPASLQLWGTSTDGTLTIPDVTYGLNRRLYVRVAGQEIGDEGTFTLDWAYPDYVEPAAPDNDHYADATALTGTTGSLVGTTFGATVEAGEDDEGPSVWYRFDAPSYGTLTVLVTSTTLGTSDVILVQAWRPPILIGTSVQTTSTVDTLVLTVHTGDDIRIRVSGTEENFTIGWTFTTLFEPVPEEWDPVSGGQQHLSGTFF